MTTGYRRPVPSGGFELWAWVFMRLSGLALLFLAVFHLVWMHHVVKVENLSFDVVAVRWANPLWRLYDFVLLWLALLHGANGLRVILEEMIRAPLWRWAVKSVTAVLGVLLLVMGAYIILAFRPV